MKPLFLFLSLFLICSCGGGGPREGEVWLVVENPLEVDRSAEMVEVPVGALGLREPGEGECYVVSTRGEGSVTVPSQVTYDGKLIFPSLATAGGSAEFAVTVGPAKEFAPLTAGRVAPERYDDFIWENDRVGFRIYGAALEPIDGPSNGIDALYKRTVELVLDKWYADSTERGISYHDDNGTGLDDYKVGPTLGAGAAAPYVDGRLVLNGNYLYARVLDNGPLRTTFRVVYPDVVLPDGTKVPETRTFSLDAGSQLTRVTEFYATAEPMRVAVGYPLHAEGVEYSSEGRVLTVAEPATGKSSGVHLGLVMPREIGEVVEEQGHVFAVTDYTPGLPLTYYTGFGWERFGGWDGAKWRAYLDNFALAMQTPLVVKAVRN